MQREKFTVIRDSAAYHIHLLLLIATLAETLALRIQFPPTS